MNLTVPVISVSSAGDINGDGVDDVIIGAIGVDAEGVNNTNASNTGASYVVFGGSGVGGGGSLNLVRSEWHQWVCNQRYRIIRRTSFGNSVSVCW